MIRLLPPIGLAACAVVTIGAAASSVHGGRASPPQSGLYDANPNHLWNSIHALFHIRTGPDGTTYGFDTVDPLLWRETRHLLVGTSASSVLDRFLASDGERLIRDPLKRAVFQHDLWAIFDWLASTSDGDKTARGALISRVARVMRRVALTPDERDFVTFSANGRDPFEHESWRDPAAWLACSTAAPNCHHVGIEPPVATVLSLRHLLKPRRWSNPARIAGPGRFPRRSTRLTRRATRTGGVFSRDCGNRSRGDRCG